MSCSSPGREAGSLCVQNFVSECPWVFNDCWSLLSESKTQDSGQIALGFLCHSFRCARNDTFISENLYVVNRSKSKWNNKWVSLYISSLKKKKNQPAQSQLHFTYTLIWNDPFLKQMCAAEVGSMWAGGGRLALSPTRCHDTLSLPCRPLVSWSKTPTETERLG